MAAPQTRYARHGEFRIGYQVWGAGPIDVIIVYGTFSHIELAWDSPEWAHMLERFGRSVRMIHFDRLGTGVSDRPGQPSTLEERADGVLAVMDAVGSKQVALIGESEGGPTAMLFAATHPERLSHLVLYGSLVRVMSSDDFPDGMAKHRDRFEAAIDVMADHWGEPAVVEAWMPGAEPDKLEAAGKFFRMATSPKGYRDTMLANLDIDIRPVLPTLDVPTLVLHKTDDPMVRVGQGRFLAEQIPGARLVELPGKSHVITDDDADRLVDVTVEFVTGTPPLDDHDRVLATVLFTDIVGSTEHVMAVGDARWRTMLDEHDRLVRDAVLRGRGRVIKTTGDGVLAMFDGPARAVRAAAAIAAGASLIGIEVRAGVHTGEVELRGDDIGGAAVHIGARVAALAGPGTVLVSRTVVDLVVGSQLEFSDAGVHQLRGIPGEWQLFQLG